MALILRTALAPTRLERSAAVERLEPLELVLASYVLNGAQRLRINPLMVSPSNHWNEIRLKTGARQSGNYKGREGKKGIRKILTRTSVPLELPANRRPGTSFPGLMMNQYVTMDDSVERPNFGEIHLC